MNEKIYAFVRVSRLGYEFEGNDAIITFTNGDKRLQRVLYVQNGQTTTNNEENSFPFVERIDEPKVTINLGFSQFGETHKTLAPIEINFLEYFANNMSFVAPLKEIKGDIEIKFNNSPCIKKPVSVIDVRDNISEAIDRFLNADYIPETVSNLGTQTGRLVRDGKEFHVIFDFTSSNATEHYKNGAKINLHDVDDLQKNPYKFTMCLLQERIGTFFIGRTPTIYGFGYQYRNSNRPSISSSTFSENLTEMLWPSNGKPKGLAACIETYEMFLKKFAETRTSSGTQKSECQLAGPTEVYDILKHICGSNDSSKIVVIFTDGMIGDISSCPEIFDSNPNVKFLFVVVGPKSRDLREDLMNNLKHGRNKNYIMISSTQIEDTAYDFKPVTEYIFS